VAPPPRAESGELVLEDELVESLRASAPRGEERAAIAEEE
jgi:hypothetical protein